MKLALKTILILLGYVIALLLIVVGIEIATLVFVPLGLVLGALLSVYLYIIFPKD